MLAANAPLLHGAGFHHYFAVIAVHNRVRFQLDSAPALTIFYRLPALVQSDPAQSLPAHRPTTPRHHWDLVPVVAASLTQKLLIQLASFVHLVGATLFAPVPAALLTPHQLGVASSNCQTSYTTPQSSTRPALQGSIYCAPPVDREPVRARYSQSQSVYRAQHWHGQKLPQLTSHPHALALTQVSAAGITHGLHPAVYVVARVGGGQLSIKIWLQLTPPLR